MPGSTDWTKGWGHEYDLLEQVLNSATPAQHQRFIDGVRARGEGLMEAHAAAYFDGRTAPALRDVEQTWFGINGDPMWVWDSSLTPAQIHEVMKETRARTAELLVQHPDWKIELWVKCGHARFRTTITWPSTASSTGSSATDGLIRCWVQMPFNSGYNQTMTPATAPTDDALNLRDSIIAKVNDGTSVNYAMTSDDLMNIANGYPAGKLIWRRTVLAVEPAGPVAWPSLAVTPRAAVTEPLPVQLPSAWPPFTIAGRVVPGIEISWFGAGGSRLHDKNGNLNPDFD